MTEQGLHLRNRVVDRRRRELRSAIADARLTPEAAPVLGRLAAVLEELG
jgi:hypothetical protein